MFVIFFRTIILYLIIVLGLRIMGKRQLGELQPAELVVTILISNIATLPIEDTNVPLIGGVIPILTLVCSEVLVSALTLKSKTARKIISGNPKILIRDGKIDQKEMRNLRFSIDDLMEQLRTNKVFNIQDVAFAIVETTGKLSIYQKFDSQNVTASMLNLTARPGDEAPPAIIISDGKVIDDSLKYCNLRQEWLDKTLKQNGYDSPKEIFLMTCNREANYTIVKKEKKK